MKSGTKTVRFIKVTDIPTGKFATYLRIVAAYRPKKDNPRRIRFTIGGNLIDYLGKTSTKAANITTVKILFNSIISTEGARFITLDLKDFYLNTPMEQFEYMRIPLNIIPDTIIEEYNLRPLIHKEHVYVEIQKGMYGLPQAGKIANDQLIKILNPHGYTKCDITPGLWKHATLSIQFCLVVDDFGIKYTDPDDVTYLIDILKQTYKVSIDWEGKKYLGMDLNWDYINGTCDISMPKYIQRALTRFQHPQPSRPESSPHKHDTPNTAPKSNTPIHPTPHQPLTLTIRNVYRKS